MLPIAFTPVQRRIEKFEGGTCVMRMAQAKAGPVITDNGNYVVDWHFDKTREYNWQELNMRLKVRKRLKDLTEKTPFQLIPGIVETGLFLDCVNAAYLGMPDGSVCALQRDEVRVETCDVVDNDSTCVTCQQWGGTTVAGPNSQ